jgi:hypothetical protein
VSTIELKQEENVKAGKAPALTLGIIFLAYQQSGNLHRE